MPLAQAEPTAAAEFPAWECSWDCRHAFDGARPTATAGGTPEYTAIASAQWRAIADRLKPPLRVFGGVFGVLSATTELIDRDAKADELGAPPLIGRDVMPAQTAVEAMIVSRKGDACARGRASGCDAMLKLAEFNVALPLAEVYRRIVLDD